MNHVSVNTESNPNEIFVHVLASADFCLKKIDLYDGNMFINTYYGLFCNHPLKRGYICNKNIIKLYDSAYEVLRDMCENRTDIYGHNDVDIMIHNLTREQLGFHMIEEMETGTVDRKTISKIGQKLRNSEDPKELRFYKENKDRFLLCDLMVNHCKDVDLALIPTENMASSETNGIHAAIRSYNRIHYERIDDIINSVTDDMANGKIPMITSSQPDEHEHNRIMIYNEIAAILTCHKVTHFTLSCGLLLESSRITDEHISSVFKDVITYAKEHKNKDTVLIITALDRAAPKIVSECLSIVAARTFNGTAFPKNLKVLVINSGEVDTTNLHKFVTDLISVYNMKSMSHESLSCREHEKDKEDDNKR